MAEKTNMIQDAVNLINKRILENREAASKIIPNDILIAANLINRTIVKAGKIFICGCGGSAAQAQHFAAELVGRYKRERYGLPAIALTADTAILTAVGNDYGFDVIFSRQLQALSRPGDLLIALSTSGRSASIISAIKYARLSDISILGFTGHKGWDFSIKCDHSLVAESEDTAIIQETHLLMVHLICEIIEGTASI